MQNISFRFLLGVKKGFSTPTLSTKMLEFQAIAQLPSLDY